MTEKCGSCCKMFYKCHIDRKKKQEKTNVKFIAYYISLLNFTKYFIIIKEDIYKTNYGSYIKNVFKFIIQISQK